jgi:hypothetical protein
MAPRSLVRALVLRGVVKRRAAPAAGAAATRAAGRPRAGERRAEARRRGERFPRFDCGAALAVPARTPAVAGWSTEDDAADEVTAEAADEATAEAGSAASGCSPTRGERATSAAARAQLRAEETSDFMGEAEGN